RSTLSALAALAATGYVEPALAAELAAAYRFLRDVEHKLQIVQERRTQLVPSDPEALLALARRLGFRGAEAAAAFAAARARLGAPPRGARAPGAGAAHGDRALGGARARPPPPGDLRLHHRRAHELPPPAAREPGRDAAPRPPLRDQRVPLGVLPPPSRAARQPGARRPDADRARARGHGGRARGAPRRGARPRGPARHAAPLPPRGVPAHRRARHRGHARAGGGGAPAHQPCRDLPRRRA